MIHTVIAPSKQLVLVRKEGATLSEAVVEAIGFCFRESIESCILFVDVSHYLKISKDSDYNRVMVDYNKQMELENQYF